MKSSCLSFCVCLALSPQVFASSYPQIDVNAHWVTGTANQGFWSNLQKPVRTSSTVSVNRNIFYNVALKGIYAGGSIRSTFTSANEVVSNPDANTRRFTGRYTFNVNGSNKTLESQFNLYKDGRFSFQYRWLSSGVGENKIYLRVDYDLITAADDIVEFAMDNMGVDQWTSFQYDYMMHQYPAMPTTNPTAIERNAYCRIVDAQPATQQLSAVFWPFNSTTPVDFLFTRNDADQGIPPTPSFMPIQNTQFLDVDDGAPPWRTTENAYGSDIDQLMYITLHSNGTLNSWFGISGKVFQKPNARPLRINAFIHQGAYNFVPDMNVTIPKLSNRSIGQALNDLTNSTYFTTTKANLPYAFTGNSATMAQMHDFMTSARSASPTTYTAANRDNFRDWFVDVNVINALLDGDPGFFGVMFDFGNQWDYPGQDWSANPNHIEREGVAISYPACAGNLNETEGKARTRATIIHEIGHAFNLRHTWGNCAWWPSDPCVNGTIMTYSYQGTLEETSWSGTGTMTWDSNTPGGPDAYPTNGQNQAWYSQGPESWVKPGRYGTFWFFDWSLTPPPYSPY